ncbi:arf-GAP with coiled-coil, ANK repeat and PH domain-containing protein 2-like [Trichomycterus rosablanca]|uniref:arf-GAP with coiled-coil, ANK repeat and PH domain-containing protein 2-like n=1 Tax=Trichomycterus rosablanca TaxID=2290929 RepID=UPI002F358954
MFARLNPECRCDEVDNVNVLVQDLRLCSVKQCEDVRRCFCFQLITPTKTWMLQADSEKIRQDWIRATQSSIITAFSTTSDQEDAELKSDDDDDDDVEAEDGIMMEGFLFKRATNAFKTWSRRWFSIKNHQILYQSKFKNKTTVMVEDLRLCLVTPCEETRRCCCFQIITPTKSVTLQADSEETRQGWISAIQSSIITAFNSTSGQEVKSVLTTGPSQKDESPVQKIRAIEGNDTCCECGRPEPEWASVNQGITLCIRCSGIHRSLGVNISRVRSLILDTWTPETIQLMCERGNNMMNLIYEARREELGIRKPQPGDSRDDVESYIRAKYIQQRFIRKEPDQEPQLLSEEPRLLAEEPRLLAEEPRLC